MTRQGNQTPHRSCSFGRRTSIISPLLFLLAMLIVKAPAVAEGPGDCGPQTSRFETFFIPMPALARSAEILVYLPPGYDCTATRRYPVFYLNDGQQLFDWSRPRSLLDSEVAAEIASEYVRYGTWRLASQLDQAVADSRLPPMIIVGIASENGPRARDLVPVPWAGAIEGRGTEFGHFVANMLVPEIDRHYRTRAERQCRGVGGSSLGGVSSLQMGLAHASEFGLVLSLSPVLGDRAIADHLAELWMAADSETRSTILVDFDVGPVGDADMNWLTDLLDNPRAARHRVIMHRAEGSTHTIDSWAQRVIPALETLIGTQCIS